MRMSGLPPGLLPAVQQTTVASSVSIKQLITLILAVKGARVQRLKASECVKMLPSLSLLSFNDIYLSVLFSVLNCWIWCLIKKEMTNLRVFFF